MSPFARWCAEAVAGALVGTWCSSAAVRAGDPRRPLYSAAAECVRCGERGGLLLRALGGRCPACGGRAPRWALEAQVAGAAVPLLADAFIPIPAAVAAAAIVGWLLLAAALADALTLTIPHAYWTLGTLGAAAWLLAAGGPPALLHRAGEVGVLELALGAAAAAAGRIAGQRPLGAGDYGLVAFVTAWGGLPAGCDAVFLAALLALWLVLDRRVPARRRTAVFAAGGAAVTLAVLAGTAGEIVAAALLAVLVARASRPRPRAAAQPFGACLAAAVFLLVCTPAPAGAPLRAAAAPLDSPHAPTR